MDGENGKSYVEIPYIEGKGGPPVALIKTENTLSESIKFLCFTPIIGSETSVIGREDTEFWQQMSWEMCQALRSLEYRERKYLSSLMRNKNVLAEDEIPGEVKLRPRKVPSELADLRRELVKLASRATEIFAGKMKRCAVSDMATYSVNVGDNGDINELNELLVKACLAALPQVESAQNSGNRKGLDEGYIYQRLLELTLKFMGGEIPATAENPFELIYRSLKGCQSLVRTVRNDLQNLLPSLVTTDYKHKLFLYQLEWLANLVFHSFSFDGQFYPTSDELSFRVALHIPESDRRPAPVNAFEKGGESVMDAIPEWFRQYEAKDKDKSSQIKEFYDALARILITQDKYWHDNECNPERKWEPVVFSLNLDLEMEKALERQNVLCYDVVMPVEATPEPPNKKKKEQEEEEKEMEIRHLYWLRAKFSKNNNYQKPTWDWFSGMGTDKIECPLVVKLHGSPLHLSLPELVSQEEFEKKKKKKDKYIPPPSPEGGVYSSSLKHFVTLSELSYLRNIAVVRDIPEFFDNIFSGGKGKRTRHFYFLGLSTSEWNMHLRMSDIVYPAVKGMGRKYIAGREMVAINKVFDDYHSAILSSLGIKRWYGALEGFTKALLLALKKVK